MINIQQQRKEAIFLALSQIPKGKVVTYGNLAKLAGLTNGARLAARALCELPQASHLPWHRVINAQGKISLPINSVEFHEQKRLLLLEGIEFIKNRIPLARYGY